MLLRQGIVGAAISAALLMGNAASTSGAKPPDLPLDPRVVCPEGPEPAARPAPPEEPLVEPTSPEEAPALRDGSKTQPDEGESEGEEKHGSFLLGLGFDTSLGFVLRVTMTDAGENDVSLSLPLYCTPALQLAGWTVEQFWDDVCENFTSAALFEWNGAEADAQKRINKPSIRNGLDADFFEMIRSTQPLNLPPVSPIPDAAPDAQDANRDKDIKTDAPEALRRINYVPDEDDEAQLQRLNDSEPDHREMLRSTTPLDLAPATPPLRPENQRNCPRSAPVPAENPILYIDPLPRRLTIQEE